MTLTRATTATSRRPAPPTSAASSPWPSDARISRCCSSIGRSRSRSARARPRPPTTTTRTRGSRRASATASTTRAPSRRLRTNEAQVKNAETALIRAQSALAILLSEQDLVDATDESLLGLAPTPDAALDDARARRSDVRAIQARRVATEHLRRDDWAYYAPSLLAQAEAFRETATALQPGKGWQAALVLSVPFFDGGVRYGVQRERRASDEEARVQLEGLLRQVSVEVRSARSRSCATPTKASSHRGPPSRRRSLATSLADGPTRPERARTSRSSTPSARRETPSLRPRSPRTPPGERGSISSS